MKYAAFMEEGDPSKLEAKVNKWIEENRDNILEIVDVEFEQNDKGVSCVTITYFD